MKIVILQGAFLPVPPKMGGAVEKMWYMLGKEFVKKGHEVIQISRKTPNTDSEEWIDGVLHKRVKGFDTPSSGIYLKLLDLLYTLRTKRFVPADSDVIVTNTFWAPLLLMRALKEKCMVDVQRMPKGQMKFYSRSARLRANSHPVKSAIIEELPARHHNKVVVIPNPLPFKTTMDTGYNKKPVILYAGRIHTEKGLELLISAFRKSNSSFALKIVGPSEIKMGGSGDEYLQKLKKLAGDSNIVFHGPIFDIDELNLMYKEASVFAYPSLAEQGETFGLAVLEAMSFGCVPLVSDLACFKDFVSHGINGVVFDHRAPDAVSNLSKEIGALENNPSALMRMGIEAKKVMQTHSVAEIAALFLNEFEKIGSNQLS